MAINVSLAPRYWLKTIIMIIVCIVLGVWGIWDYVVVIPNNAMGAARADVLRTVKNGLDTPKGSSERAKAITELNLVMDSMQSDDSTDEAWFAVLEQLKNALGGGSIESQLKAIVVVEGGLNLYGHIVPPSKYDRPMQWAFILCLPFALYYTIGYVRMKKRAGSYSLDDEGSLTTPEGHWLANQITDIDMSTWISKTGKVRLTWTAKAVVEGSSPILLDDYVYQNMHLIIGGLAHRFYPDEWTPLARRVRIERVDEEINEEGS